MNWLDKGIGQSEHVVKNLFTITENVKFIYVDLIRSVYWLFTFRAGRFQSDQLTTVIYFMMSLTAWSVLCFICSSGVYIMQANHNNSPLSPWKINFAPTRRDFSLFCLISYFVPFPPFIHFVSLDPFIFPVGHFPPPPPTIVICIIYIPVVL